MSKSATGRAHDYKAHFTRTRLAFDKATARQAEVEAAAQKAMQTQQALQDEVDFLLDAIVELRERAAQPPPPPPGRSARVAAAAYSDDEEDARPVSAAAQGPNLDALVDPAPSAKRVRDTPPAGDVDEAVLASLGDGSISPKRARLE
ncbi:hypothetical protein MOBT1_001916 [Malassezia obtusa]|uniref:Uncharacterized protein n=1 Tax=Malassezia obtusa TaxID=76774 RepID=A0AAF0IS61_9BASI|nr:hypothetical protein MOBT1_001916 [Malassezia obtusa]